MYTGAIPQDTVQTTDKNFQSLGVSDPILACLGSVGFEHPTPIQAEVLPAALDGHDVIGLAQTGSGKTAAFVIPIAEHLQHGGGVRGLILSPTREIALQTKAFLDLFGRDHHLNTVCLIGGVPLGPQIRDLRKKPDVVVATPGRLLDHCERRNVSLDRIEILVLDEADHMLDLGFLPQIRRVIDQLPAERQTMMFSATMPTAIERLVHRMMRDPVTADVRPKSRAAEGIEHRLYLVNRDDKKDCLLALIHEEQGSTLVFLRRKVDADWAWKVLKRENLPVARMHSNLNQSQRVAALQGLREGKHRILLATDIAARGIDIPIIEHIINYDLPENVEDYIHRAGRTARGTREGTVSSIATWQNKPVIKEIERVLGRELPRCTIEGVEPYVERKTSVRGRKLLRRRLL